MYRTHTCGALRIQDVQKEVILCGWVQRIRDKGGMIWIDMRDRYGITQLVFNQETTNEEVLKTLKQVGREFVIRTKGVVIERFSKNKNIPTGDIEIDVKSLEVLNPAKLPPFTIADETDGGEELRMKYRYLDLRRTPLQNNILLRHKTLQETRRYFDKAGFLEIETPFLIKSTPEGARDFVVPSRIHEGQFYALPQSPQTFKQLLMIAGLDKYFQIVKCFRDEDLRADRQPEFTQIDCEMAFVTQKEIFEAFEGMIKHIFKHVIDYDIKDISTINYEDAIKFYGTDKPDVRFDMRFVELNEEAQNKGFVVFDSAELVVGICVKGAAGYTRKQLDELTKFVKKPQIGAKGLVYVKYNEDGTIKSSVDKFYTEEELKVWAKKMEAKTGDLMLILAGKKTETRKALSELRLKLGDDLELRSPNEYKVLWVVDFPLFEWDEETKRYYAMHHPFTSPKESDIGLLDTNPALAKANAYDMIVNGVEIGGGSIRIHNKEIQQKIFDCLGFSKQEAENQFGFLMNAFEYGAPPHGGVAYGFDRICALLGKSESIREFIAFPKNNAGRDVMIDTPSNINQEQMNELQLRFSN